MPVCSTFVWQTNVPTMETSTNNKKILVTGASGFIGSFIVEQGLARGYEVWAGIRRSSSRRYLKDTRIKFIELNLEEKEVLATQITSFKETHAAWDYVIHAAGVTKCIDKNEFMRTNFEGTKNLVDVLKECDATPRKIIYLSSLSIFGPAREEEPHTPIQESDIAAPNTAYGYSKLMAEGYIRSCGIPYITLRPTGVYGPRERDYYQMAVSIKKHIDFAVGYKRQTITFIYVEDLVDAIYLAAGSDVTNRSYFVSEPAGYSSRSFSDYIQESLGIKRVLHITAPLWVLKAISTISEAVARITGKPATLNSDKYNIMKQRNWLCDTATIEKELGFKAKYTLHEGTKKTIEWYRQEKWL